MVEQGGGKAEQYGNVFDPSAVGQRRKVKNQKAGVQQADERQEYARENALHGTSPFRK